MEKKKTVKRARPVPEERFFPMVDFMKDYLREVNPGKNASKIKKARYAHAVRCVKEMEKIITEENPRLKIATMIRPCFGLWPLSFIPPSAE